MKKEELNGAILLQAMFRPGGVFAYDIIYGPLTFSIVGGDESFSFRILCQQGLKFINLDKEPGLDKILFESARTINYETEKFADAKELLNDHEVVYILAGYGLAKFSKGLRKYDPYKMETPGGTLEATPAQLGALKSAVRSFLAPASKEDFETDFWAGKRIYLVDPKKTLVVGSEVFSTLKGYFQFDLSVGSVKLNSQNKGPVWVNPDQVVATYDGQYLKEIFW